MRVRLGDPAAFASLLGQSEAVISGHFALLGGAHSDSFIRFSRVASEQRHLDLTAQWLLPSVSAWAPEIVAAPTTAGVALASTLARQLAILLVLADVGDDGRASQIRDSDLVAGRCVLLVNDVVTTGQGLAKLADAVRLSGAQVAGAAWFVTRDDIAVEDLLDAPVAAVADLMLSAWMPDACTQCAAGEELTLAVEIN
jgi:orotate phosphoribosyltransferase